MNLTGLQVRGLKHEARPSCLQNYGGGGVCPPNRLCLVFKPPGELGLEFTLKLFCGSYDSHDLSASMFSLVVIKPQSHSVRKGRSQCIVEGSQELKQEPESRHRGRDDRGMLLFTGLLQSLLNNLSSTAQASLPRDGTVPSGLCPPTPIKKMAPQHDYRPV